MIIYIIPIYNIYVHEIMHGGNLYSLSWFSSCSISLNRNLKFGRPVYLVAFSQPTVDFSQMTVCRLFFGQCRLSVIPLVGAKQCESKAVNFNK